MYQQVKHPNGEVEEGVFPTLTWFEEMKKYIDFKDLDVVDIGCAEGMYSVLAKQNGARRVISVDESPEKTTFCRNLLKDYGYSQSEVYTAKFENMAFNKQVDVVFCNMILHWLEDAPSELRRIADATNKYIVCIYRTQNVHYQNVGWLPSEDEIERLLASLNFRIKHKQLLLVQDNDKQIFLTIFERYKHIALDCKYVRKTGNCYTEKWLKSVNAISPYIHNNVIVDAEIGRCKMRYIEGRDLMGDRPFHPLHGKQREVFLNQNEKKNIRKLIDSIIEAGAKTGIYIQDVTKRNIILKDEDAYLVDYTDIGTSPDFRFDYKNL